MTQLMETHSFTVYDFTKSKRMSYYPHNQPITTIASASAETEPTVVQSNTASLVPTATVGERSHAASPEDGLPPTLPQSQSRKSSTESP